MDPSVILLMCPPIVIVSTIAGIALIALGATKRDNGIFSLGLMLLGLPLAFTGFLLGSLVGWESGDELSTSENLGRVLLFVLGGIGLACVGLGMIGTWSKGFFWQERRRKR